MADDSSKLSLTDPRSIGAGLGAIGLGALALSGYLQVSTPECAQCEIDRAVAETLVKSHEERIGRLEARVMALDAAADACKVALTGEDP